jgi:hypothetical protein
VCCSPCWLAYRGELIAANKLLARMQIAQCTVMQALATAHACSLIVVLLEPTTTAERSTGRFGGSSGVDYDASSSRALFRTATCRRKLLLTAVQASLTAQS